MVKNRRGDGYVTTCVTVVILCMLITIIMTFSSAVNVVRITEKNSRIVLDSFVMKNSILIYDSIKNGNDYTVELDETVYTKDLCDFCTLENYGNFLYSYNSDGSLKYKISKPSISFATEDSLKAYAEYTMYVPITFGGVVISTAEIPITVETRFNEKF